MKKKNKFVEFLTKENKYEKQILMIMSIIAIVVGLLGVFGVITNKDGNGIFILFLILGPISFLISLYTILKERKENKIPKSLIYLMFENKEYDKITTIFSDAGYMVLKEDANDEYYYKLSMNNSFTFVVQKDEFQFIVIIYKNEIELYIDLIDELLENVSDDYFDKADEIDPLVKRPLNQNSNIIDIINIMDLMIVEHKEQLLQLYEKYKK